VPGDDLPPGLLDDVVAGRVRQFGGGGHGHTIVIRA
jgi:hypothetical protein